MKPYERAVRCADEVLAEEREALSNDPREQAEAARRASRRPDGRMRQTNRHSETVEAETLTQITPDDILVEEGPIAPVGADEPVSEELVEQDTTIVNPSPESMDSRG